MEVKKLMTVKYEIGTTFYDMPEPFRNLYMSIPRGFIKFDRVVEMLRTEPYKARLHKADDYWWMEFPTQEDFMAFIMKWS